ncbi:glycosyltransferase family 4 protein [Longitalea luteola]|uniref:glycosyltransferase family 4 protein n=1 Tax=Longitalea luteola TaxID=2812563 RepID=UPI001A9660FA|nr:glycosyltransferase family 4 protein [Longitalea luteola]
MMKPRILFIVQLPPPIHGVTVMNQYTVDNPGWKAKYDVKTLPLHFGQTLDDIGKITPSKMVHLVGFIFRLCRTLITFKPSMVYFTIVPTGKIFYRDALFTALIKLFCRRIIFHLHKKGIEEMAAGSRYKRWLLRKTFKGIRVICLSEKLTADIRTIYEPKPFVLPNGIEIMNKRIVEHNDAAPRILYLSNLVIGKGIEVFLQSLVELHKQGCHFHARVVGAPVDYSIEQAKAFCAAGGIAHLVDVVGPRFGADKFAELEMADIFVLPSFSECVPLSILEAMQFGVPVVATCVGGIPDILQDGVNGLLVPPGSVKDLTARLKQLLSDKRTRLQMGYSARERFMQKYTLSKFYDGLTGIFEQVLYDKKGK